MHILSPLNQVKLNFILIRTRVNNLEFIAEKVAKYFKKLSKIHISKKMEGSRVFRQKIVNISQT